jgi:SAM-dependent methyltransferase
MADLRLALPALAKQKAEMLRQTLQLLDHRKRIDGYVEIGTTGRYASVLRKRIKIAGRLVLANSARATMSPVDIVERGRLRRLGEFVDIGDHDPLPASLADASFDVVSCYIGLHHCAPDRIDAFVQSIARVLRPGGVFILRDHDVGDERMRALVALAHTVFNAGLGETWETNAAERRHFAPIAHWCEVLAHAGLRDSGARLAQQHDPSDNLLMSFVKDAA